MNEEFINRKHELEKKIKLEDEHEIYLSDEVKRLEINLRNVKNRYRQELVLRDTYKRNLSKVNKSRSWKFSLPVRKIGGLFKNNAPKNDSEEIIQKLQEVTSENSNAKDLDKKLWGGYSAYALKELEKLRNSLTESIHERMRASRSLSRWYFDKGEFEKAYEELEFINEVKPIRNPNQDRTITEIKVLKKLGRNNIGKRKIWEIIELKGLESELCLSMAHLADTEEERLSWYNLIYDKYGYQQIEKVDKNKPLDLENIITPTNQLDKELENYKISIIIPAYNVAKLIHIALNSLLKQSIQNLEIIVVDDYSPDNTVEVVSRFAEKDSRIKLIKKEKNEGAYAARNTGLKYATGDFITIHDGDDWSHSQKIETQLREILENPSAVASVSYLIRSYKDISPINGGSLLSMKFLMMNSSSLLVRKSVFDKLGGWDSVRVAGDSEFLWRIEKVYGKENVIRVDPKVPFSIALSNETSLTGNSTTHVKTINFGLRRTYREAFEWWHANAETIDELYLNPEKINRKFPCPVPNRIIKPESRTYDYVLIADFSIESDIYKLIATFKKLTEENNNIAVFHWPDYNGNPSKRVADEVHYEIHDNNIDMLVPNEIIETEKLLFLTPRILDHVLDSAPEIEYKEAFIFSDKDISVENMSKKQKNLKQTMNVEAKFYDYQAFLRRMVLK